MYRSFRYVPSSAAHTYTHKHSKRENEDDGKDSKEKEDNKKEKDSKEDSKKEVFDALPPNQVYIHAHTHAHAHAHTGW